MTPTVARGVVGAALGISVVLEAAAILLTAGAAPLDQAVLYAIYNIVQVAAGAVIVWTHPRHTVGWLLTSFGLANTLLADVALAYGRRGGVAGWAGAAQAEVVDMTSWIVGALGLALIFLLFPNGRYVSPAWRWVPAVWLVGAALAIPGWGLDPTLGKELPGGVNPLSSGSLPIGPMKAVGTSLVSAALVASVLALLLRFRHSQGPQRQQLKWVLLAGAMLAVALPASAALWTAWPPIRYAPAVALPLLPIAVCVAITRQGLYDIDLVISRTVSYAALTGALAAAYAAVVLAVGAFVVSPVAAAVGALVVAVGFWPLRSRIQDAVDRRFRRARHESRRVMTSFVDRLRRGDADADGVEDALRRAVNDVELAVAFRSAGVTYDGHGLPCELSAERGRVFSVLDISDEVATVIRHRETDRRVVADVIDAGRLALEIAALQVELRRRLKELDVSRARIVAVADEERRRLARDLHDGAQQRLVSIGLDLRHAQHTLNGAAAVEVDRTLDSAVAELANAIDELRELASGLRPASLDEGLGSALRELAARAPIPVDVEDGAGRFASDIETAAYFIACEGLTNAVKHAAARRVCLGVARQRGHLVLTVVDDGTGGADARRGTGLQGLVDRARVHGGTLTIDSSPAHGTRLTAKLPCG